METLHVILHGTQWIIFHGLQDFVSSPPQRGEHHTKPGDHDTLKSHNP
jgi:hypothetical protein